MSDQTMSNDFTECDIETEHQGRDDAGTLTQDTVGVGTTSRGSQSSSNELWATQIKSNDLAQLLQDLPVELEFTGLQISSSQTETHSQMPGIVIEEEICVEARELSSTEGDIAGSELEDVRELSDTHSTQQVPFNTLPVHSIKTTISD